MYFPLLGPLLQNLTKTQWTLDFEPVLFSETLHESDFSILSLDDCKKYCQEHGIRITLNNFCMNYPGRASCPVSSKIV